MTLEVKRQITSKRRYYDGENPVNGITIHMTANTNAGADAQAHANLQSKGNVRVASWQWTVDDIRAIQSYEDFRKCWHAGDGRGPGNTETTAIEICVNSDGDYEQAVTNAAELAAMLMKKHGHKSVNVISQHNRFSTWGKNCPRELRGNKAGISWEDFLGMVQDFYLGDVPEPPKPKPEDTDLADDKTDVDGYWGTDTTIELQHDLGTPVDGEVWNQSQHWLDENPALTWGWKASTSRKGSPMIYALYDFLVKQGVSKSVLGKRDGKIGPKHIKGLQTWLRDIGLYKGSIDGILGTGKDGKSSTVEALQTAINRGLIK